MGDSLSPAERTQRARLAAHTSWAKTDDRTARTAKARAASPLAIDYWKAKVRAERPDLSESDVTQRATSLHKAHQARNALKAAKARRARRADAADVT